jgi:hypothetical protein
MICAIRRVWKTKAFRLKGNLGRPALQRLHFPLVYDCSVKRKLVALSAHLADGLASVASASLPALIDTSLTGN